MFFQTKESSIPKKCFISIKYCFNLKKAPKSLYFSKNCKMGTFFNKFLNGDNFGKLWCSWTYFVPNAPYFEMR